MKNTKNTNNLYTLQYEIFLMNNSFLDNEKVEKILNAKFSKWDERKDSFYFNVFAKNFILFFQETDISISRKFNSENEKNKIQVLIDILKNKKLFRTDDVSTIINIHKINDNLTDPEVYFWDFKSSQD